MQWDARTTAVVGMALPVAVLIWVAAQVGGLLLAGITLVALIALGTWLERGRTRPSDF